MVAELPLENTSVLSRERLFIRLYEAAFPSVAAFVSRRNGSFNDAKDIFQDALVIFYEKYREGDLEISISDEAYLLGIAKHLWIRKFNHDKSLVSLDDAESAIVLPDDHFPEERETRLVRFLEFTGRKCMELLQAFYYHKRSMKDIRNEFGYSSEHSATVQKFKCLEKIREKVKEKEMNYEDFTA